MFVLNINVFYVCFSEKINSTESGKTLNTLIFLFTKQRIIIIMMCIFSSNRWTGVLHGLRITVSYQKPTVPTKFLTPVSRLQVSPTVCLDSPGAAAAITSLLKVHRLTDLERGKDDFKLSCAKLVIQTHAISYSMSLDEQWILNTLDCVPTTPEKQWSAQLRCQEHSKLLCINYLIIILHLWCVSLVCCSEWCRKHWKHSC